MLQVKNMQQINKWRNDVQEEQYPAACEHLLSPSPSGDETSQEAHSYDTHSAGIGEDNYLVRLSKSTRLAHINLWLRTTHPLQMESAQQHNWLWIAYTGRLPSCSIKWPGSKLPITICC